MSSEDEEEETLLLVELHGVIDSEIFVQDSFDKFKLLAIDAEHPILQVENCVFSGEYEHTLGTAVLFEEEEKRLKCDPVFCKKPPRMLKYVCKTNSKLNMKRVFVSEKQGEETVKDEGSVAGGSSQATDDTTGDPLALDDPTATTTTSTASEEKGESHTRL